MKASPIIFSDASPIGIKSEVSTKVKIQFRQKLTEEQFNHQIESIKKSEIFSRVKLIFLSGLDNDCYSYFNEQLIKLAESKNIQCVQIPFLFGNNMPKIKQVITKDIENEIVSVYNLFINSFPN